MKITMQMTLSDLIRALRWQALNVTEQVATRPKGDKDDHTITPKRNSGTNQ
jgi:hypothetical protein